MVIVIDLSKKKIGFNLFESFFYTLKNDGTLVFVNDYKVVDDSLVDYNDLKISVQNILYEYHASSYSLCILYDMNEQLIDPLKYSIVSNIYHIKENIIKPLSQDYILNKLYYFSLDSVNRNIDNVFIDDNVRMANSFDSKGYVSSGINNCYSDIIFNEDEIEKIDNIWYEIKNMRRDKILSNNIMMSDLNQMWIEFSYVISMSFQSKINLIRDSYSCYMWYANKLNRVYDDVLVGFKDMLYKNGGLFDLVSKPSEIIKNSLKMVVSTYSCDDVVIIRYDMNDKEIDTNREVLKYRHQLEIIAFLIYLATNDTKLIFDGNKLIGRENHWNVNVVFNEENLCRMLNSYNLKLKMELDKISKFVSNEIEYMEFSPRTFNVSREMENIDLPVVPNYSLFPNKRDSQVISLFADKLYKRYLKGINYADKRISLLTSRLRIQRESNSLGELKSGSIIEINAMITKMEDRIRELESNIAVYRPMKISRNDDDVKLNYDMVVRDIQMLMDKRISKMDFIRNIGLILIVLLNISMFISLSGMSMFNLILSTFIIPLLIYIVLQIEYLFRLKYNINKKILELVKLNEEIVFELFSKDKDMAMYIHNIYDLIMLKKYVLECKCRVNQANIKFRKFNYHYDRLREHIEISDKLIELLDIKEDFLEQLKIDKIKDLNVELSYSKNPIYCPLSYLIMNDMIRNDVIVNDLQSIKVDSKLIGFVDKIIITYDKEYENE